MWNRRGCRTHPLGRWSSLPGTTFDEGELAMIDGLADGENGWQQACLRPEPTRRKVGE